ncbi:hypothetical protein F5Y19DRAFT_467404 [Xylariaceae sp. FL1651]|nr:hypothetical protein F5Y19DRAFT_467404 [Xylariaceae sp. FL1651]
MTVSERWITVRIRLHHHPPRNHILDPRGDVIIILCNSNAPFAVLDESENLCESSLPPIAKPMTAIEVEKPPCKALPKLAVEGKSVFLQVSLSHLRLASPKFEKDLDSPLKEPQLADGSLRYIDADNWGPQALLIVVQIIHGRNRCVPRTLGLEMLAKVAVVIAHYKCYEMVQAFAEIRPLQIKEHFLNKINRDLILLIIVSWVFRWADIFKAVSKTAIEQSQGPLPTLDCQRREEFLQMRYAVHGLFVRFRDDPMQCSFECSLILLGALIKEMHKNGLELHKWPDEGFMGYSRKWIV